jgi:hypothetical protein
LCIPTAAGHRIGDEIQIEQKQAGGIDADASDDRVLKLKKKKSNHKNFRSARKVVYTVAGAACLVFFIGGGMFASYWDTTAYSIYIDINPSVHLEVNALNRVISTRSLNADGVTLLDESKPHGNVIEALDKVVRTAAEGQQITSEGVAITIATSHPEELSLINKPLEEALSWTKIRIIAVSPEDAESALMLGVLPHRYVLAKQASIKSEALSFETALTLKNSFLESVINGTATYPPEPEMTVPQA